MTCGGSNLFWAQLIIEELRRHQIDYFCVCPGARSAPFAIALSHATGITPCVHQDERGTAYHAVGYARATGRAAVVITTSGTATANLYPAVIEAAADHLPLIVITADRPPELHDCGANQTIDQQELFGSYSRLFVNVATPDDHADPQTLLDSIDRAVFRSHGQSTAPGQVPLAPEQMPLGPGPVHLNCMFREPLLPDASEVSSLDQTIMAHYPALSTWLKSGKPKTMRDKQPAAPDDATVTRLVTLAAQTKQGALIVGRLDNDTERQAALNLGNRLGWPILPDITSGLALVNHTTLINHHDLILASPKFVAAHQPDTVLHVGGRFVSKRLLALIENSQTKQYIHNSGDRQIIDPTHGVTASFGFDNVLFCNHLSAQLPIASNDSDWLTDWTQASAQARNVVANNSRNSDDLTEPQVASIVSANHKSDRALFLASSMPIRDMNMFGLPVAGTVVVGANRGASGIDGTIATAAGFAAGHDRPVTLLIGDQAFLYDMNSLALLSQIKHPVTIVVINNDGGRIFEQLPIKQHSRAIEPLFVAPHGLHFDQLAAMYGIDYARVVTGSHFLEAIKTATKSKRSSIIEAVVDSESSSQHRQQLIASVNSAIDELGQ